MWTYFATSIARIFEIALIAGGTFWGVLGVENFRVGLAENVGARQLVAAGQIQFAIGMVAFAILLEILCCIALSLHRLTQQMRIKTFH
jgi:hypothetical protein